MAKKTYWELLRDPRWQRMRLQIMERAEFRCETCDDDEKTLNVHHKIYRKGAMPWEYDASELACLCEDCHQETTDWRKRLDEAIARMDVGSIEQLVGFAEGLAAVDAVMGDREESTEVTWVPRSYGHVWGFLVCLWGRATKKEVETILSVPVLSNAEIWALGTQYGPEPSSVEKEHL